MEHPIDAGGEGRREGGRLDGGDTQAGEFPASAAWAPPPAGLAILGYKSAESRRVALSSTDQGSPDAMQQPHRRPRCAAALMMLLLAAVVAAESVSGPGMLLGVARGCFLSPLYFGK